MFYFFIHFKKILFLVNLLFFKENRGEGFFLFIWEKTNFAEGRGFFLIKKKKTLFLGISFRKKPSGWVIIKFITYGLENVDPLI